MEMPRLFVCTRFNDAHHTMKGTLVPTLPCAGCTESIVVPLQLVKVLEKQPHIKRRLVCGRCADRAAFRFLEKLKVEDPERFRVLARYIEENGGKLP